MKSLKIKLNLDYLQKIKLNTLSNEHRLVYNYLLSNIKNGIDFKTLHELSKNFRKNNNLTINAKSCQNTAINLINNCKSFFQLKKDKNNNAKFPYKFKSWKYFTTFILDWNNGNGGFKINNNILSLSLDSFKNRLYITLPKYFNDKKINNNNIKQLIIKKENNNYYVIFQYSETSLNIILNKDNFISIDLGISNCITACSNVIENFQIKNNLFGKDEIKVKEIQSKRDLRNKLSNKWYKYNSKFKKLKNKLTNKRKDYQHKVSKKIIDICKSNNIGEIICGDIKTKKLKNNSYSKLNNKTQNTGTLSRLKTFLEYKSKNENIDFILVNEVNTSKINCITGKIEFDSNLSIREVEVKPNIKIDRDLNSAINIAQKFKVKWLNQIVNFNLQKMYLKEHSKLEIIGVAI